MEAISCDLNYNPIEKELVIFGNFEINGSDYGYRQKLKNLERLIEIAKEYDNYSLEEFIDYLQFQVENGIEESNGTIIELGDIKPVQLMTVHKSNNFGV